jgi:hypothetical protein
MVLSSIKELFLLIFSHSIVMKWDILSSIVDEKIKKYCMPFFSHLFFLSGKEIHTR